MLSLGTELRLAFCTASYSVGLPAGSGPPLRAATSTFLMSLANSLPRRASTTAVLCLVVAHLEWPLMTDPSPCQQTDCGCAGPASARDGTRRRWPGPGGRRRSYPCAIRWRESRRPDRLPPPTARG